MSLNIKSSSKKDSGNFLKKAASYFFSYMASVFALMFILLLCVNQIILRPDSMIEGIRGSQYVTKQTQIIQNKIINMCVITTEIPETELRTIITQEVVTTGKVMEDSEKFIKNCLSGNFDAIDVDFIGISLGKEIRRYYSEKDTVHDLLNGSTKNIKALILSCEKIYKNGIEIGFLKSYGAFASILSSIVYFVLAVFAVLWFVCLFMPFVLNIRLKSKLKFVVFSLSALVLTNIMSIFILKLVNLKKIAMTGNIYYLILKLYNNAVSFLSVSAICCSMLMIFSVILYIILTKEKKVLKKKRI